MNNIDEKIFENQEENHGNLEKISISDEGNFLNKKTLNNCDEYSNPKNLDTQKILDENFYGKPHKLKIRGQEIDLYIGTLATQSDMSLILNYKSVSLFFAFDISKEFEDQSGFSQFVVHFITKSYAVSKIPNNPTRRENKISERDVLISRLIDRSIRPLIHKNFNYASQLICTLLSYPVSTLISDGDEFFDIEFLAVLGASITIHLSSVPLNGIPIPCKVLMKNKKDSLQKKKQKIINKDDINFESEIHQKQENNDQMISESKENQESESKQIICFPFMSESQKFDLDLFLSFNEEELIMIEAEAKEVSNEEIVKAVSAARESVKKISMFLKALTPLYKKKKIEIIEPDSLVTEIIEEKFGSLIEELLCIPSKTTRNLEFEKLNREINLFLSENHKNLVYSPEDFDLVLMTIKRKKMYKKIKETGKRIDGRGLNEIRKIDMSINPPFMESSHGSSIFKRGETRALVSVILGTMYDEQIVDGFESDKKERFILHYNFLPYATGEVYQLKNTNRREIGHGRLAFKAIKNLLPEKKIFPYTFRVCSEILSCDGSSSMATICAASIALMDAGVPISECAAGIAIGISKDLDDDFKNSNNDSIRKNEIFILSDLIGDEDHIGNMDFKIAGTKKGITALQMDVKDFGIKNDQTLEMILEAGKTGYLEILDKIFKKISGHRIDMKKNAPSIIQIMIEKNCVKSIIGNRGETIKTICEVSGAKVDIDSSHPDHATINIFGPNKKSVDKAEKIINDLILQPEVGRIYDGLIDKITDFGIFVRFLNDKIRGLIHERNCEGDRYDFYNRKKSLKIGEPLKVKVLFISADGKVGLSIVEDDAEIDQKDSPIIGVKALNTQKIIDNIVLPASESACVSKQDGEDFFDKKNNETISKENNQIESEKEKQEQVFEPAKTKKEYFKFF